VARDVAVWAIFTMMLFIAEPLFLHRWFLERAQRDPEGTFRRIERMHWVLLTISLVTVAGAAPEVHGCCSEPDAALEWATMAL